MYRRPDPPVTGRPLSGAVHARVRQMLTLERLCARVPRVIASLAARPGLVVAGDGDLRAVLYALLLIDFDDVRVEPWPAPGRPSEALILGLERSAVLAASAGADVDFAALMAESVVDGALCRERGLRALVRFLYDPAGHVSRPRDLERALGGDRDGLSVRVVVAPQRDR